MASQEQTPKDHWSARAYTTSASFVPRLTSKVLSYLSPQPGEKILDLGCGDGPLTAQIAAAVAPGGGGHVVGLDSSPSMISSAQAAFPHITFRVQDCTRLPAYLQQRGESGAYDKVFSNAALHWILRAPATRRDVFAGACEALKPGGVLVLETGGFGNVGEVHAALVAALMAHGFSAEEARETSPWFFPTEDWMRVMLEDVGFEVEKVEVEFRPTRLTSDEEGGLAGWLRLMGAQFFEKIESDKREEALQWVCDVLKDIVTAEDGSGWLQYKRLRAVAKRK